jgi:hypothetical protein
LPGPVETVLYRGHRRIFPNDVVIQFDLATELRKARLNLADCVPYCRLREARAIRIPPIRRNFGALSLGNKVAPSDRGTDRGPGVFFVVSPSCKLLFQNIQIDFVQMPSRMGLQPAFAQVRCDHRPKMVHTASDGLIGDRDPAFCQQIFDVAQGKPDVKPDRLLDDFGRKAIAAIADLIIADGTATGQ